jgi:type I restriction enzyme, R subunit
MIPQHPTEKKFENHIEQHLLNSGYLSIDPLVYDKSLCLIPTELLNFIKTTQNKVYLKYERQFGSETDTKLIKRVSSEIENRGVIEVLRNGVKSRGCHFRLVYFTPKSGLNIDHQELYKQNNFNLIRQLKYSQQNENSIDMGVFINGIPIVLIELKNSLTGQTHEDGIKQWKQDRDPKEPLFKFKRILVYFSVGNEKVFMSTRLSGDKTVFLPFNKNIDNPVNPKGFKTHYLWEETLQPTSLLDLIENYVHIRKETESGYDPNKQKVVDKKKEVLIFPRYHQLNVVRKIKRSVIEEGVGNNYLIQHTTGSGKSLSIGWLSHLLSSLYQKQTDTTRMFDSIIVVTDRRVLDKQIRNTIQQLEQTKGVVCPVDINSQQLKEYLEQGKSVIVTTIQKFPVISNTISELNSKTFGVIIDEVHSSQSGETSKHLKMSLSKSVLDDYHEGDDEDLTEVDKKILDEILIRGKQKHISYFGFSGTPKNKTLELFGRKDNNGNFIPFDLYSMKQSIGEGFTLDVLKDYTTYKRYFKLNNTVEEDKELPESRVKKMLVNWVDIQPHTIKEKTRIILEHFINHTSRKISGKGCGMLVTRSRLHCVKFKLEFDKQMKQKNLPYRCLVGFSGTVHDSDSGINYTESSMNGFSDKQTRTKLKNPEYRILIVNNKFQTGFDEPLLHTMYVDKMLRGLQCVQTLSRLNRTYKGKNDTFVLDFVNEPDTIRESFKPYYDNTMLSQETEPDRLYHIEQEIKKFNLFSDQIIDDFIQKFYDDSIPLEMLQNTLDSTVEKWMELEEEQQEEFRSQIQSFIRLYGYITQIVTFQDIGLEKLFVFLRFLNKKIPSRQIDKLTDIVSSVDLESFKIEIKSRGQILVESEPELSGIGEGIGTINPDEPYDFLSSIIKVLNESFGTDLTDDDKINLQRIHNSIMSDKELNRVHQSDNTETNKRHMFNKVFEKYLLDLVDKDINFYNKMKESKRNEFVKNQLYEFYNRNLHNYT